MATLGRWKKSQRKRGRFIRSALRLTEATQAEIHKRSGVRDPGTVSQINLREKIRPYEISRAIAARHKGYTKKKRKRKKVSLYSEKEKYNILKRNKRIIDSTANSWWKGAVEQEFGGNRENFLKAVNLFVFQQLDYFDPERKYKDGTPSKLSVWIEKGVRLYCKRKYFDLIRRKTKERAALEAIAAEKKPMSTRSWVPATAKPLLRKLGLDIEKVADVGYNDVRKQIMEIVRNKKTGLTQKEKTVVRLVLEGKTLIEIAKRVGWKAKSTVYACEAKAIKKIKKQLPKKEKSAKKRKK